ncbi:hypothetical protein [Petrotoga sibirica]|uniref:Uncharacterized protein n=2 Tax=Petrotoga sibirica TaxID=156202 RepID=A0A4R8EV07_9BACT|nr:hypothetical protein [Petrotoga sibirica]POZ89443.1 hypothetical protein AA80_00385 [Petrotoga sibirica DSM 13575]TDX16249.1 hypothetical protein C8D74_10468 [Petrotoga sibirica]
MRKIILLIISLNIFNLMFSLNVDSFFKSVELVNSREEIVSFYFTNDSGRKIIIYISSFFENSLFEISYPNEISLLPYEAKKADFFVKGSKSSEGTHILTFSITVEDNLPVDSKVSKISFPIIIKIVDLNTSNMQISLDMHCDFPFISNQKNLGTFFPIQLANNSKWEIDVWGTFSLYKLSNNQLIFQKSLFQDQSINLLPHTSKEGDIFIEKYLAPEEYKIRAEIYYGYKNYFQEKYVYEKEFKITEDLYKEKNMLNINTYPDQIYIKIPKLMTPREYITTPLEFSLDVVNNDFLDINVFLDFEEEDEEQNFFNRKTNDKYLSITPNEFSIPKYQKVETKLIADYRRSNLVELSGEYYTNLSLIGENNDETQVVQSKINIPITLDFGDNIYNSESNIYIKENNLLNDFYNNITIGFEIKNTGNSSVHYDIYMKKWNSTTNSQVGNKIIVKSQQSLLAEQTDEFTEKLVTELGVDKILIEVVTSKGTNPSEIIKVDNYSLKIER